MKSEPMKNTVRSCGGVKPDTQDDVKSPAQIEAKRAHERAGKIQGDRDADDRLTPSSNQALNELTTQEAGETIPGFCSSKGIEKGLSNTL